MIRPATREVWVTGLGAVTAAGVGAGALRDALHGGRSGVTAQPDLDGARAGRAPDVQKSPATRKLDRSAALFFTAALEAWSDAGLDGFTPEPWRCGVIEGSSLAGMAELLRMWEERAAGSYRISRPSALLRLMIGAGGAAFAQAHAIDGPVLHLSCGSVSAMAAIGEAFDWIAGGRLDVAIAGGAECPLHPEILGHFAAAGVLSPSSEREHPCRPFADDRDGTVLGEGAGVLVLEAADHARRRGASPRVELEGYGLSAETHSMTAPDPDGRGVTAATRQALAAARRGRPDWVKAHGTASALNDLAECRGLASLFGADLAAIPLAAFKPYVGHCLGASGSVEAVATALALEDGLIPAVLGTRRPDPDLPACCVNLETRRLRARSALLLSESFGGRCAALLMAARG